MNTKGQGMVGIGAFIVLFITVIVGMVLLQATAVHTGQATGTFTATNVTYTLPAAGESIDLDGQEYISGMIVINDTSGTVIASDNYTISEGVSSTTGVKTIILTYDAGFFEGESANISYVYGSDGYIDDSGARGIANLILIFFALGIAVVVLIPTLKMKFN